MYSRRAVRLPSHAWAARPPDSTLSLGGGRADGPLAEAGFEPVAPFHNQIIPLRLPLGPKGSDRAWMTGLLPLTGLLKDLHEKHGMTNVFERAREAFDEETAHLVDADSGDLVLDRALEYRVLCVRKPC